MSSPAPSRAKKLDKCVLITVVLVIQFRS